MSIYYPQASLILKVRWEDFGDSQKAKLQEVYDLPILARRVTVNINDYRSADTFSAEIDYKNFPFDPRSIRACGVSIFMKDMGKLYNPDNSLNQIQPQKDSAVFVGFVDEESMSFDDQKRTVNFEGRDFTSILIDTPFSKGTVNLEQPVDEVIRQILAELVATQRLELDNRVEEALPVIAAFSESKDGQTSRKNVRKGESYWDVIQDIVQRAGLIAYIELDRLVISKPRVLYDKQKIRPFTYGKNISQFELKRKLGRRKNFNIVVRGLVLGEKRVEEARIPLEATDAWAQETGIVQKEVKLPEIGPDGAPIPEDQAKPAPYIAFLIPNVSSKTQLLEIGQQIYEEIGRQQIEGSFETKDMSLCVKKSEGSHEDFSILKLRNGTPVSIEIEQGDLEGVSRLKTTDERKKFLISRCYDPVVAQVFAETLGKPATPFYTKAVEFTMDAEQGFSCKVDFINFIENINKGFGGKGSG